MEPVFPLLKLPLELRYHIYKQLFEPNKPLGLANRSADGAEAVQVPTSNVLFTSKQVRQESMKLLQDNVPFMLNLGHASVSETFGKRPGCDTTGDDAREELWESIRGFKTVILSLGTTSSEKLTRGADLELTTDNMRAVFRALCGRGIEDRPRKKIIVRFNFEQLGGGCRDCGRLLAVLQTWMQYSTMISVRCDISASTVRQAPETFHLIDCLYFHRKLTDRVEVVVDHGQDESERSQEGSSWLRGENAGYRA